MPYLLFGARQSETQGGWKDLRAGFPTLWQATQEAAIIDPIVDWWHVVDAQAGEIVKSKEKP